MCFFSIPSEINGNAIMIILTTNLPFSFAIIIRENVDTQNWELKQKMINKENACKYTSVESSMMIYR